MSDAASKQGGALIDAHTPLHAIVGFAAGVLGVDPHIAMIVFIGARITEAAMREGTRHALFEPEHGQSLGNELTDLLFEMGGLHAGEALRHKLLGSDPEPTAGLGGNHYAITYPNSTRVIR